VNRQGLGRRVIGRVLVGGDIGRVFIGGCIGRVCVCVCEGLGASGWGWVPWGGLVGRAGAEINIRFFRRS
jgi:hypothetical protein